MSSKELAQKVSGAVERREVRDSMTFGLYTVKRRRRVFSLPFVAPSDDIAFDTIVAASHDEPSLQGATLLRVGDFCLADGSLKSFRNPKIIVKNHEVQNKV